MEIITVNRGTNVVIKKKKARKMTEKRTGKYPNAKEFITTPEYKMFTKCNELPGFK